MLEQFSSLFRKASLAAVGAGMVIAFWTEATADIPVGKNGTPKPPLVHQRLSYAILLGSGLPGLGWGLWRAIKGEQRTPWE